MKKAFYNCDVLAVLQEIVGRHVKHYQSDFEIDKNIIRQAAVSGEPHDNNLLWMARPCGTHCHRESDVYVNDTYPYHAWVFYGEQTSDPIVAYAIEIQGFDDTAVTGNLYELDYPTHFKRVQQLALPNCGIPEVHTRPRDEEKWAMVLQDAKNDRHDKKYKAFHTHNYLNAFTRRAPERSGGVAM